MDRRSFLKGSIAAGIGVGLLGKALNLWPGGAVASEETFEIMKTEEEWRALLTAEQYGILRKEKTEAPFKNQYHDHKALGVYHCAGCDLPLFSSKTKYDSKTGWPSFWEPIAPSAVKTRTDWKLIFARTEVHCRRCGGHLGHVFDDGPPPTGLRYCINSGALKFVPA